MGHSRQAAKSQSRKVSFAAVAIPLVNSCLADFIGEANPTSEDGRLFLIQARVFATSRKGP
jgi:hypothetical protein